MKNKKIISVLMVFSSSELGGRTNLTICIDPSSIDYRLATLDGEGHGVIGCVLKARNLCIWIRNGPLHGTLRLGAFLSLLRYVRRENIKSSMYVV